MKKNTGIKPLGYRVLVKPRKHEEKTQGGIILPDRNKERDQMAEETGVVVAMGQLAFTTGTPGTDDFFAGEGTKCLNRLVSYPKYSGDLINGVDGESYRLMHSADISAILEEDKTNG